MRMRIHEPDFAAEKRSRFRPLKERLWSPVIDDRPVHQPRAVRKKKMLANEPQVLARLGLGEQAANHALRHRQQRIGEARFLIAWVQQELGLATFRPEHAIAGDDSIAKKIGVEVLAHRGRERVELLGALGCALRLTKDFGVAAELLVKESDGPSACHPIACRRIDRPKRVVPIAVAITNKVRAGNEARAHRLDQLDDVSSHQIDVRRLLEIIGAAPRNRLVEEGKIAGGLDVVTERFERPDDNVAMRLPVLHDGIGFEHEPLRPVAALFVLLSEENTQNLFDRLIMFERQQEFDRTLADVTRAPGAPGILFETVRRGQVNHPVMRKPREDRVDGERVRRILGALHPNPTGKVSPEPIGRLEHRRFVDRLRILRRKRIGLLWVGHRAHDREHEFIRRLCADRDISAAAALSVGVEQFVAAYGFDSSRRAGHQTVEGFGILLAPAIVEIRPESEAFSLRVDLDAAGRSKLLLSKNKVAENEKATSWPFNRNTPLYGGFVAANGCRNSDSSLVQTIDPAAVVEAHFKSGRDGQQAPTVLRLYQHAQSARAGDVVGIAGDGKELVE